MTALDWYALGLAALLVAGYRPWVLARGNEAPLSPDYQCRVEGCDWDAVQGGLCVSHERWFQ